MEKLQGSEPGLDPNKFGLKFDSHKSRWDLIPMQELKSTIGWLPDFYISRLSDFTTFDEKLIHDNIMFCMSSFCISNNSTWIVFDEKISVLQVAILYLLYLLRGKPYTEEELNTDCEPWHLISLDDIDKLAKIYEYGACLYAEENWKSVDQKRYISAFFRHFIKINTKQKFDNESGSLHSIHALWNLLSLLWLLNKKKKAQHK